MQNKSSYKLPIIISVLLHIIILFLLFTHFRVKPVADKSDIKVIQATAVSANSLAPAKSSPPPLSNINPVPNNRIRQIEQTALKETQPEPEKLPKVVEAPQPKAVEELPEPDKETIAMQQKQKKLEAQKKEKEKKRLADEKRKQLLKNKLAQAKKRREEETKRMQNEIAKEAQSVAASKKNVVKTEESANPNESDDDENNNDDTIKTNSKGEQKGIAEAGELDKYKSMIIKAISRQWLIPDTENNQLACQLLVHVGPGGVVVNVDILKESGDENLDRSARNAIMKASPLPVPEASELFDKFRALRLTFRPQGIISE